MTIGASGGNEKCVDVPNQEKIQCAHGSTWSLNLNSLNRIKPPKPQTLATPESRNPPAGPVLKAAEAWDCGVSEELS